MKGRGIWSRLTTGLGVPFAQDALRGRVHKMSVCAGGEVSIVVRFGIDEPRARGLNQGVLLDIVPHTAGKAAAAILKVKRRPAVPVLEPPQPSEDDKTNEALLAGGLSAHLFTKGKTP